MDLRWSWERVMESDELVGRIKRVSRLPQYLERGVASVTTTSRSKKSSKAEKKARSHTHLIQAMLTGAETVASYTIV